MVAPGSISLDSEGFKAAAAEAEAADYKIEEHQKEVRLGLRHRDSFAVRRSHAPPAASAPVAPGSPVNPLVTAAAGVAAVAAAGGGEADNGGDDDDDFGSDDDEGGDEGGAGPLSPSGAASSAGGSGVIFSPGGSAMSPGGSALSPEAVERRRGVARLRSVAKGLGALLGLRTSKKKRAADAAAAATAAGAPPEAVAAAAAAAAAMSPSGRSPRVAVKKVAGSPGLQRTLSLSFGPRTHSPAGDAGAAARAAAAATAAAAAEAAKPRGPDPISRNHLEPQSPRSILRVGAAGGGSGSARKQRASAAGGDDGDEPGLSTTPNSAGKRSALKRRISFADHHGHKLEAVKFCDDLHYSDKSDHSESAAWDDDAPQRGGGGNDGSGGPADGGDYEREREDGRSCSIS